MSLVAYGSGSSDESEDEDDMPSPTLKSTHIVTAGPSPQNRPTTSRQIVGSSLGASSASTSQCYDVEDKIPHSDINVQSIFKNLPKPKDVTITNSSKAETQSNESLDIGLFNSLPLPKSSKNVGLGLSLFDFESDEKNVTPNKKTVKITVPSLSQYKDRDDQEPVKKKAKPSSSGSGLFSLLPAPKNIIVKETKRSLVPHILTKKPAASVKPVALPVATAVILNPAPPHTHIKSQKPLALINYEDSGEDSEEENGKQKDFFSLHSDQSHSNVSTITPFDNLLEEPDIEPEEDISNDQPLAFVAGFQPSPWANNQLQVGPSWPTPAKPTVDEPSTSQETSEFADYISVVEDDIQLDDEALQRLCGRRAKAEQMEFINVNGSEIMPDPKEWLVKQLSQEQPKMRSHSHKKNDGPTTQQRRKHQITYLAFQAKENELELKNQWSQNRMSRKQTQSKYGF